MYGLGGKLCYEEFDLHADICNLGSGFLATDYSSFLQSPGTQGQNMRSNRLSHILYKSSMNTVLFVNANTGFSENLFLVIVNLLMIQDS